jgi:hypothetical protein
MKTSTVDTLIWVYIYGGLLAVGLGLMVRRTDDTLGHIVIVIGAVVTAVGVALVYVRSRMKEPPSTPDKKTP